MAADRSSLCRCLPSKTTRTNGSPNQTLTALPARFVVFDPPEHGAQLDGLTAVGRDAPVVRAEDLARVDEIALGAPTLRHALEFRFEEQFDAVRHRGAHTPGLESRRAVVL